MWSLTRTSMQTTYLIVQTAKNISYEFLFITCLIMECEIPYQAFFLLTRKETSTSNAFFSLRSFCHESLTWVHGDYLVVFTYSARY